MSVTKKQPDFPWRCYTHRDIPIYFHREEPNWFVPNRAGDKILSNLGSETYNNTIEATRLLARLPRLKKTDYPGRGAVLQLNRINELWFHLTNRCNMSCRHCLFCSSPEDTAELDGTRLLQLATEAYESGCRLFTLTGGEPLVHPQIEEIVGQLLAYPDNHVVMLTNGLALPPFLDRLEPNPETFHLQISLDGLKGSHDALRGNGAFTQLSNTLQLLKERKIPYTLSMCVTASNVHEMAGVVDFGAEVGVANIHFMWYFVRGRGDDTGFVEIDTIYREMVRCDERARHYGITIDNLEALKTQVFSPPGTIHDGTTAGWESLAVGPDGKLYPSAALVGVEELATEINGELENSWRHSPVLQEIRNSTVCNTTSPLRFILGGGDSDHSYLHKKSFLGGDPYEKLYEKLTLYLIGEEVAKLQHMESAGPGLRLQMGEIQKSCGAHGRVVLIHSNCLLATAQNNSLTTIKEFYSEAVADTKEDILNPVCYEPPLISHIPEKYRFRGYGCGSPIMEADIQPGDHIVDLGCGRGIECFIASRLAGKEGRVIGVDMLDPMLALATEAKKYVAANLGYDNLDFRKGYLEDLPVESNSVDVVISNCVMNLSVNKRLAYGEILRVLRPGGKLVIADVTCETEPDPSIRNDDVLKGECIGGALTCAHLTAVMEEVGFENVFLLKRFPYREIDGHPFFSLTYSADKPAQSNLVRVIYRGPSPTLILNDGALLQKGVTTAINRNEAERLGEQLFILDDAGNVQNIEAESSCGCSLDPEESTLSPPVAAPVPLGAIKQAAGCMVCGESLTYEQIPQERNCSFCSMIFSASSVCDNGHFVCDQCHGEDAVEVMRHVLSTTRETDLLLLFEQLRKHPAIPMHGPEYHAMVPGIIHAVYRNLGGQVSGEMLETALNRGRSVAGGFCGFMGVCGSAVGVGIALSLLLDANPVKPKERKIVQTVTQNVLKEIATYRAARCCQRDCWIALTKAAELSERYLDVTLKAEFSLLCGQYQQNNECIRKACPLYPVLP